MENVPEVQPKGPYWRRIVWQCEHPPPTALTREEIAERLRRNVPEFCDRLMDMVLPAIGLWPQRRAETAATASRFGGTPLAPPDWQWPTLKGEPLLFVGQINCAELRGLPGAELLPSSGLLGFFGDYASVPSAFIIGLTWTALSLRERGSILLRFCRLALWCPVRSWNCRIPGAIR
jgi:hypothetical protein